jgi:hypothetical protein
VIDASKEIVPGGLTFMVYQHEKTNLFLLTELNALWVGSDERLLLTRLVP